VVISGKEKIQRFECVKLYGHIKHQSIAVGSKTFIETMKEALGFRAKGRKIICADDTFELRETITPYGIAI
jgi:hypothetical protein